MFKKLNLKEQEEILMMNEPEGFEAELAPLADRRVVRDLGKVKQVEFALSFVTTKAEVNKWGPQVASKAEGDAVVWFAYPKKSSKKYASEVTRDEGWEVMGEAGFEPVRMVAVDEDWSAIRFRRVERVKSMTRNPKLALTKEGKKRTKRSS